MNDKKSTEPPFALVSTVTCMDGGGSSASLTLNNVVVKNLIVAGLGPDENDKQLQQIDRLFAITAWGGDGPSCGGGDADPNTLKAPTFHISLEDWTIDNGYAAKSEQCNYVNNHKGDWQIKLVGAELKGSYDEKNPCPEPDYALWK